MQYFLLVLLSCIVFSSPSFAAEQKVEKRFETLEELGNISKPFDKIRSAQEAFNFIMADKIVRESISNSMQKGYTSWKVTANPVENETGIWEVNIASKNKLPPFTCYYRFDSIGNDKRERPWAGCQYE